MSVEAQACVKRIKLPPGNSPSKFVLLILADHASGDPMAGDVIEAWPSTELIVESTDQDRKTVLKCLQKLQQWGLIEDTGKRKGRTRQVKVWQLNIGPDLLSEEVQFRNPSKYGTVPKTEPSQNSAERGPYFRGKGSVFGTRNPREPKGTIKGEQRAPAGTRLPPDWKPSAEELEFARQKHPGLDLEAEADKFRDYWHAAAGAKALKADWPATWRNWIRRADAPKGGAGPVPGSAPRREQERDWREPSESRLEAELGFIRHQHALGALSDEELDEAILRAHAADRARRKADEVTA